MIIHQYKAYSRGWKKLVDWLISECYNPRGLLAVLREGAQGSKEWNLS